jgi:MFS superfamily sulfate permease-like transporter
MVKGVAAGNLFKPRVKVTEEGEQVTVQFRGALGFHNFIPVRSVLDDMPRGRTVLLDFTGVHYIDPTVLERLHDFEIDYAQDGGTVRRIGDVELQKGPHPFSTRTVPKVTV